MLKRIYSSGIIIGGVIVWYFIMAVTQPVTNQMVATANTSANWTAYGPAQAVMLGYPLWQWFLPAGFGIVALILAWKIRR